MTENKALQQIVLRYPEFDKWELSQQLEVIGWFLHAVMQKEYFTKDDLKRCLGHLDIKPSDYLLAIDITNCKSLVSGSKGFNLHYRVHAKLDKQLEPSSTATAIHQLLQTLPKKISIAEEKVYLLETLKCLQVGAKRAAIVMAWNLAFSHLCNFILKDPNKLAAFNQELQKIPKTTPINVYDDFSRLKESTILDICNTAKVINKNQYKIFKEKLDTRNMAAHPFTVPLTKIDTEHYILYLVNNLVLPLLDIITVMMQATP